MAMHQKRSGEFVTSFACKQGDHGEACDEFVAETFNAIVCHCDCHPLCDRPACETARTQGRKTA